MNKMQFAALSTAKEGMAHIQELADEVMHKPTKAFSAITEILSIANTWLDGDGGNKNKGFRNCQLDWRPTQNPALPSNAVAAAPAGRAAGAFIQGN